MLVFLFRAASVLACGLAVESSVDAGFLGASVRFSREIRFSAAALSSRISSLEPAFFAARIDILFVFSRSLKWGKFSPAHIDRHAAELGAVLAHGAAFASRSRVAFAALKFEFVPAFKGFMFLVVAAVVRFSETPIL